MITIMMAAAALAQATAPASPTYPLTPQTGAPATSSSTTTTDDAPTPPTSSRARIDNRVNNRVGGNDTTVSRPRSTDLFGRERTTSRSPRR